MCSVEQNIVDTYVNCNNQKNQKAYVVLTK